MYSFAKRSLKSKDECIEDEVKCSLAVSVFSNDDFSSTAQLKRKWQIGNLEFIC